MWLLKRQIKSIDVLKLVYGLMDFAHNLNLLLLQVNKHCGNCEFLLFKEKILRRFTVCFSEKTACVSPMIFD